MSKKIGNECHALPGTFVAFRSMRKIIIGLAFCFALIMLPNQALGVNVVMNFDSGSSDFPAYDPDGSKLTTMMSSVEALYQDIFENSGTLNVTFYYDNIGPLATTTTTGIDLITGHPTSCTIVVGTNETWFIDETPFDNSEFNMTQTLAGSLANPGSVYDGTVPALLEYTYKGTSNGSDPNASGMDMWSTLIHEMGHGMGMNALTAWSEVIWDDDYDFSSSLVWGNTMAADGYSGDNYHLAGTSAMYPYGSAGHRDCLSATDLFAIACGGNWGGSIDLERKDFYSTATNADLNAHSNWAGNWRPDSTEDAWIRDGGSARLTADLTVNELYIGGSTTVRTGAYDLRADQNCQVGNGSDVGYLEVESGGKMIVDKKLAVKNGSQLIMDYNSQLDVDVLEIQTGGELIGRGFIMIDSAFNVNGKITTSGGGYLSIHSDVPVNLDGGGNGELYVTGGNFSCNNTLNDAHDGYIKVGSGYSLSFDQGWSLGSGGVLDLDGSTANTQLHCLNGVFRNYGEITLIKDSEFYCDTTFESTSTVNLPNSEDDLYMYGDLFIEDGATLTGAGRLYGQTTSSITLEDGATIDVRFRAHGGLTVEEDGIGSVTCNVAFALSSDSDLYMEASGDGVCDFIDSNNATTWFRGTLHFDFINGYTPDDGDSFTIMNYDIRNGTFASIDWDGDFDLIPNYGATALTLTVSYGDDMRTEAVPEPSTLMLLLGAGGCLVFLRRRRLDE